MEGRSSPLAWRPCTGQASQLSLVCERATASNVNSSRLLFRIDNLRPKLLTSKNQTIVNLGEEYLSKLQLLLLERDRSGYSRWSDELRIVLRELFCLNKTRPEFSGVSTSVKTQTLLVLAFAEPNL
ncbi:hypothetical protein L3X38_019694 [Prunus dulcis]|uniref:Uncharacterized protein n=1 Tax=Prunus dulcis TaxID=3755 RepID=A0AAD4ZBY8_PRUDU|nr:hypothetical protein L3X38_019694 [Prunus dulcis]